MMAKKELISFDLSDIDLTNKKQAFSLVLIGIIISLILGVFTYHYNWGNWIYWLLLVIGIIVGVGNIFHEEGVLFLVAGLTLTLMLNLLASITLFPVWATILFTAVVYVLAPTMIIVSLKVFYALALK